MSIEAISWASRQQLPPRDKFVLVALCDHYNRDEQAAWMRQETLAEWTGYSRATVNAALDALERQHGLIRSETRRYADGRNAAKIYRLVANLYEQPAEQGAAPSRVNELDSGESSVNSFDSDSVNAVDTDSVDRFDSKNQEHRTVNLEPLITNTQSPEAELAAPTPAAEIVPQAARASLTKNTADQFLTAWNEHRGQLPAVQVLTDKRRRNLRSFLKEVPAGTDPVAVFTAAVKEVAADSFWVERKYNLDNLLRPGRVIEKAEKHAAGPAVDQKVTTAVQRASSLAERIKARREHQP